MRKLLFCSLPFLFIAAGCVNDSKVVQQTVKRGAGQQDVAMVKASNHEMNAAMDEARGTVGQITTAMQSPKPGQEFTVKVRVTDGKVTEYMWLNEVTFDGTAFHGKLEDDAYEVAGYKMGKEITVPKNEIADWIIRDNGNRIGGYTEKVIEESEQKP